LRSKPCNKTIKSAFAAFSSERCFRYNLIIEQTFFYLHLDASKSTKIPFFEKKIEIENFDEKKSGFFYEGATAAQLVNRDWLFGWFYLY
jgi:hypothetical protein